MENAFESCQAVISMCEWPFVGFDVKEECAGVEFSRACRTAGCSGELCNLFEIGIQKCHNLCKLGPMNDDCRKCAYLPRQNTGGHNEEEQLEQEINGLELIHSLARGRKERLDLEDKIANKKKELGSFPCS